MGGSNILANIPETNSRSNSQEKIDESAISFRVSEKDENLKNSITYCLIIFYQNNKIL